VNQRADSYVCGISDSPLLRETIGRSLDRARARWGDREALVFAKPQCSLDLAI
jgi:fatty-acyl-CoA synthase